MSTLEQTYNVNDPDLRKRFFNKLLPEAIDTLDKNKEPDWGKMNSQKMIEHLMLYFKFSTDKLDAECKLPTRVVSKYQDFLKTNNPMPKGITNPLSNSNLSNNKIDDLDKSKVKLKHEVKYFQQYYKTNPNAVHTHPLFGNLDAGQWERYHYKHCFHHFSQFNLIQMK